MKLRFVTRVVTYNSKNQKILLVKNRDQNFWYPPGGGWEYKKESIIQCAEREVMEETGLAVKIKRLLYVQEFHESSDSISFETVWMAVPQSDSKLNELHIDNDVDGKVEKAQWFSKNEVEKIRVYPERLQNTFWSHVEKYLNDEDPFIPLANS